MDEWFGDVYVCFFRVLDGRWFMCGFGCWCGVVCVVCGVCVVIWRSVLCIGRLLVWCIV